MSETADKNGTTTGKEVIRGLEGVVAAETDISYVDGANGDLYYKGYNIHDLAGTCTYMEVAYLLLNGELPTTEQLQSFRQQTVNEMRLPAQIIKMMEIMPPSSHPMDVLRTTVSALSYFDPECDDISQAASKRKAIRLIAQIPTIVVHLFRIRRRESLLSPDPQLGMAGNMLYMMHGRLPSEDRIRAMDQLLFLHADHGMNASTFAARVTASTHADMHSAITSAIGTLKGPLHGGANERVMKMLKEINNIDEVDEYIESMLAQGLRVMGFGHRVYKKEDPRARHLRKSSELLCGDTSADKNFFEISHRIENIVMEKKGIYPNVDFYSATVQHALGIPEAYYTTIFAASRVSGWTAHVLEQYANNRLIRPTSKYTGRFNRPFVPIGERTGIIAVEDVADSGRTGVIGG